MIRKYSNLTKYYIFTLLVINYHNLSFAQSAIFLKCKYTYLNLNSDESGTIDFSSNSKETYSVFNLKGKPTEEIDSEDEISVNVSPTDSVGKQYYQNDSIIIFKDYIIEKGKFIPIICTEAKSSMKWVYLTEKSMINNLICYKATTSFRGRNYIVHYTTQYPMKNGLWKFSGLPGLIVKVESDDKTIFFDLIELKLIDKISIVPPSQGKQIDFPDFVKYKKSQVDDFVSRLLSKLPRGATVEVNSIEDTNLELNFDF
jgi:GLPGLI family protein